MAKTQKTTLPFWEILVPYKMGHHHDPRYPKRNKNVPLPHHKRWDEYVRRLTGGLTIFKTAYGEWISETGKTHSESMIPVRIACTEDMMERIANYTLEHYKQEAVFYYKVSDQAIILSKK